MEQLKPYNIYSYRELCNSIGEEPVKGGNKRVAQEKRIESHYRLEKVNRKFKIIEIYSEQKEIIDNRKSSIEKCGNLRQTLPLLALGIDDHGNNYKCLMTAKQLLKTTYGSTKENEIKRVANDCILKGFITKDNRLYKAMINYQVEIAD